MSKKTYLVKDRVFPYCKGCGHSLLVKSVDSALGKLECDPLEVTLVSDIGCVGLADALFTTHTVHSIHGRSTAIATGLSIADGVLCGDTTIFLVFIGDGGATIGLAHLIDAARLNVNITVILHNNFLYGMTGGQHSGFTPCGFVTATTKEGNPYLKLNIIEILKSAHAGFLSRKLAADSDLDDEIKSAITYPGFSLVEVIEICTGYGTRWNNMSKKKVLDLLSETGEAQLGRLVENKEKVPFREVYNSSVKRNFKGTKNKLEKLQTIKMSGKGTAVKPPLTLSFVIAGTAGEGVQFASRTFLSAFVQNGYNGTMKNDNPVTIGSGFSLSEIILSSREILYSRILQPDFIIITTKDGLNRAGDFLDLADSDTLILLDDSLKEPNTKGKIIKRRFVKKSLHKNLRTFTALGFLFHTIDILPVDSFCDAIYKVGKNVDKAVLAVNEGYLL